MLKPQSAAEFNNWTEIQKANWINFDTDEYEMSHRGATLLYTENQPEWIIKYSRNKKGNIINIDALSCKNFTERSKRRKNIYLN